MNILKKINGWVRLWVWGLCPQCNHDAPELYDCKVCDYYEALPRYRSKQTKEMRRKVWIKFLNQKDCNKEEMETIETIIISGFPGTGKSYYVDKGMGSGYMTEGFAVDSDSSKFEKKDFPSNYISHIQNLMGSHKIIFVSSHKEVRQALVDNGIKFTLVYPNKSLKIEYLKRYIKRGSSEEFIDLIYKNWESWIGELEMQKGCKHQLLNSGEYMSNLKIF